jgi:hypothetical protein
MQHGHRVVMRHLQMALGDCSGIKLLQDLRGETNVQPRQNLAGFKPLLFVGSRL